MKKNLSILFVIMACLSLLLAACGGAKSDNSTLTGTWTNDASAVTWTFTADGNISSSDGQSGTYTFDGSKITTTASDGTVQTWNVVITGNKMVETTADGTVFNYTKGK